MTRKLFLFALAFLIVGCATAHPTTGPAAPPSHGPGTTPHGLENVGWWLELLAIIGVPAIAAGITLLIVNLFNPLGLSTFRLSLMLSIGGASLFGVSVLLRASLWLVPWVEVVLCVLALAALAYEIYVKASGNKSLPDPLRKV